MILMQAQLARWFITLQRRNKAIILISADVFFVLFALWSAFSLRWGVWYVPKGNEWYLFAVSPVLAVPIFVRLGLYRAIIRYIEIRALWTIVQATTLYALVFAFVLYESGIKVIPRTVSPLNWLIVMLLIGGSRFIARWWLGETYFHLTGGNGRASTTPYKKTSSSMVRAAPVSNWHPPWRMGVIFGPSLLLTTTPYYIGVKLMACGFIRLVH